MTDFAFPEISNSRHVCGLLVYNHLQNLDNSKPSEYLWEALECLCRQEETKLLLFLGWDNIVWVGT